jgi:hypothetical protein
MKLTKSLSLEIYEYYGIPRTRNDKYVNRGMDVSLRKAGKSRNEVILFVWATFLYVSLPEGMDPNQHETE